MNNLHVPRETPGEKAELEFVIWLSHLKYRYQILLSSVKALKPGTRLVLSLDE
jgi:hypothetical protein